MSSNAQDRLSALLSEQASTVSELDQLKTERAAALIDGSQFLGAARISELTAHLETLEHAIALLRPQAEAEQRREVAAIQVAKDRATLESIEAKARLQVDLEGEVAAYAARLVDAIQASLDNASSLHTLARPYTDPQAAMPGVINSIEAMNIDLRNAEKIILALNRLGRHGGFGSLTFPALGGPSYDTEKALAGDIGSIQRALNARIEENTAIANG